MDSLGQRQIDGGGDIPSVLDLVGNTANDSNGKDLLFVAVPDKTSSETLEACWGGTLAQAFSDLGARAGVLCCGLWNRARLQVDLDNLEEWYDPLDEGMK